MVNILVGVKTATSYDEFEKLNSSFEGREFPLSTSVIDQYYDFGEKLAYKRICDYAEEMIRDDSFKYDFYFGDFRFHSLKVIIKGCLMFQS